MEQENKMKKIDSKRRVVKLLEILSYFMAVLFTLVGTVSCVGLMIFLYEVFNISFIICVFLTLVLPCFYSHVVNYLIDCVDSKRDCVLSEISFLEEDYNQIIENSCQQLSVYLSMRFNNLSRERQLELLNYIKGDLPTVGQERQIGTLNCDEMLRLMCELDKMEYDCSLKCDDSGYSRRRIISDEIDK